MLAALPRPWSIDACTHALLGFPTPHSRLGSDLDKTRFWTSFIVSGLRAVRSRPLPEQRSMLPVVSILLSTVELHSTYSFHSKTFSVFLLLHRASALLTLLSCAYLLVKTALYTMFNINNYLLSDVIICKEYVNKLQTNILCLKFYCKRLPFEKKKLWKEEGIFFERRIYWIFRFCKVV